LLSGIKDGVPAVESKRILIADDHSQSVAAARAALNAVGYEVIAARTVPEAARALGEMRPDLILLDAALSGGDTVAFCSSLARANGPERVPVLILAPPRCPEPLLASLRPFGAECLFKPFHAADLRQRVKTLLTGRSAPASVENASSTVPGPADALREESAVWNSTGLVGAELGGCRLDRVLGHGATSTVYLGRHLLLDVRVAVKVFNASSAQWGEENLRRFIRGARAAAKVEHPNLAGLLNAGQEGEFYFLVQRYIEGETLKSRIERTNRLDEASVVRMLRQIAAGLSAVHAIGILHRDVKPANIILAVSGEAVLTDFGLARAAEWSDISSQSGMVGTPLYMSPEQCAGRAVDARSDLYSLGASGYHAATGRPPFIGDTPVDVVRGHTLEIPPWPQDLAPVLSSELAQVLMKLLEKSPGERYSSAEELIRALERI
jgi:CheY-like chemotaxis protein/tRNA A-37 threonylcarbamoyl transferase component Bud32